MLFEVRDGTDIIQIPLKISKKTSKISLQKYCSDSYSGTKKWLIIFSIY